MSSIGRLEQAIGVVNGINLDFEVPVAYMSGSLVVFRNGQQLKRELDNGWIETDPTTGKFQMKIAPLAPYPGSLDDCGDIIFAYFNTVSSVSTGGAVVGGIPNIVGATHIYPLLVAGNEILPQIIGAGDIVSSIGIPITGAEVVYPKIGAADNLRPTIAESKEV